MQYVYTVTAKGRGRGNTAPYFPMTTLQINVTNMDFPTQCNHCERVFDARGEACETINQYRGGRSLRLLWICADCSDGCSVEELAEYFELPVEHVLKELGLE